jgi:hypothetical protein
MSGLGGGLAFTLEPEFCEKLLPQVESFIRCAYIQSAILRAFETWSSNHPDISFVNVTDLCAVDPSVVSCLSAGDLSAANCSKQCSAAEIVIVAEDLTGHETASQPASVQLTAHETGPRSTSGPVVARDLKIEKAVISINIGRYFHLDSTFCVGMHEMEAEGTRVLVVFSLVFMPLFGCASVTLLFRFLWGMRKLLACRQKDDRAAAILKSLHMATSPIWAIWLLITVAIVSGYVYWSIAAPCVRTFDFEASMVHYVGETLGLSDPSVAGSANWALTAAINSSTCGADPAQSQSALLLPSNEYSTAQQTPFQDTALGEGPAMLSPTLSRAERCPSLDDIQGLHMLYPTCSMSMFTHPKCVRSNASLGWLRFAQVVILGIFVSFVICLIFSWGTAWLLDRLEQKEVTASSTTTTATIPADQPESQPAVEAESRT